VKLPFLERFRRKPRKTVFVAFTVDVDRDAAEAKKGRVEGLTNTPTGMIEPRFENSAKGFFELVGLLNEMKIPATFFVEGETARKLREKAKKNPLALENHEFGVHGLQHEDYTGKKTGVKLSEMEIDRNLAAAITAVSLTFGIQPKGFRAPYVNLDSNAKALELVGKHFKYDSSFYGNALERHDSGLHRIPVAAGTDARGRTMQGYLWKLMEGTRDADEYVDFVRREIENGGSVIVLGTHSWHHNCSPTKGRFSEREASENLEKVKRVLAGIRKIKIPGVKVQFATLSGVLKAGGKAL